MANEVTISVPIPPLDQYEVRLLLHSMQVIVLVPVTMQFFEDVGPSIVVTLPAGVLSPRDVRQAVGAALRSIGRSEEPGEPQVHN